MKRYFEILGIPPTKNENIIKKAYRKKAMKYHPDRNPSLAAKDKFIEITEAYDQILLALEQGKNPRYTSQNRTYTQTNTSSQTDRNRTRSQAKYTRTSQQKTTDEREERVKEARRRYEYMKRKEELENERYFRKITSGKKWKRFKIVMLACTLTSLIVTLDRLYFPTKTQLTQIEKSNISISYSGISSDKASPVLFSNGQKAWLHIPIIDMYKYGKSFIYLERTLFFKDIKYVKVWKNNKWSYYTPDFSLMSIYPLFPIILLIPLFAYFIKGKTFYFSLAFNVSIYIMPVLLLFFFFSNDRWIRILTLGVF